MKKQKISKEDYFEKLTNIEKHVIEIFNEITEEKNFSLYSLELLDKKIELLKLSLTNVEEELNKFNINLLEKSKKLGLIKYIPLLIGLFICTTNYFAAAILQVVFIVMNYKEHDYINSMISKESKKEFEYKNKSILNTIVSCSNFIEAKTKKIKLDNIENAKETLSDELWANHVIEIFIKEGLIIDMPERINNYLILLLQYELGTPEEDLTTLLSWVKEDIDDINKKLILKQNNKKAKNLK